MLKELTTALGLVLFAGALAFASQAPSTKLNQASTKAAAAQATPSSSQQQQAPTSGSTKKHKKHHKEHAASDVTSKNSTPKP
jgi:hypothetical protein